MPLDTLQDPVSLFMADIMGKQIVVNHYLNPNALCPKDAASLKVIEENHLGHFA